MTRNRNRPKQWPQRPKNHPARIDRPRVKSDRDANAALTTATNPTMTIGHRLRENRAGVANAAIATTPSPAATNRKTMKARDDVPGDVGGGDNVSE